MKRLGIIAISSTLAVVALSAAESKPLDIPQDKQEAISREMIAVQAADLQEQQAQLQLIQLHEKTVAAHAKYEAAVKAAQEEYHAQGCDLTADKKWICPTKDKAK